VIGRPDCRVCAAAAADTVRERVYEDAHWHAATVLGVPGWIVMRANRHVEGFWAMQPDEARTFGVALQLLGEVVMEVTRAERMYLASYGEQSPHLHVLLLARYAGMPSESRGARLLSHAASWRDPEAAVLVATRTRELLEQRVRAL
jgi:diadenosine tetraphosphate (Ap4A) HIT family hydrolase